jgi:hypothetical protein
MLFHLGEAEEATPVVNDVEADAHLEDEDQPRQRGILGVVDGENDLYDELELVESGEEAKK